MFGKIKKFWKDFDKEVLSKEEKETNSGEYKPGFGEQKFDFKGQR